MARKKKRDTLYRPDAFNKVIKESKNLSAKYTRVLKRANNLMKKFDA